MVIEAAQQASRNLAQPALGGHRHQVEGVVGAAAFPGRFETGSQTTASTSPAGASAGDQATSSRPPAVRSRKNPSQPAPSSLVVTWTPRISRCPSALIPVATRACTGTTRPPSRTLRTRASAATNVNGPAPPLSTPRGRVRNSSTWVSSSLPSLRPGTSRARYAQRLHQLVHPPGRDTEQVAGRHHRGQRLLRAGASLQEPLGEIRTLAELGDRDVQGAGPGVEVTVPVAIPAVDPLRRAGAVRGPQTESASADSSVWMKVPSSSRSRSGLAWASCSSSIRAGSILGLTVIVCPSSSRF